jgi:hypothetical protein
VCGPWCASSVTVNYHSLPFAHLSREYVSAEKVLDVNTH